MPTGSPCPSSILCGTSRSSRPSAVRRIADHRDRRVVMVFQFRRSLLQIRAGSVSWLKVDVIADGIGGKAIVNKGNPPASVWVIQHRVRFTMAELVGLIEVNLDAVFRTEDR